jgi:hypothetical protein
VPKPETIALIAASHFRGAPLGDVISFSLTDDSGQRVFSFQIAQRDLYLEQPIPSSWNPVLLETFRDNVVSKMVALVDRGAPREFVDVYEIVNRGLISLAECWALYSLGCGGLDHSRLEIRETPKQPSSGKPHGPMRVSVLLYNYTGTKSAKAP